MATAYMAHITLGFESRAKPVLPASDMPNSSAEGGAALVKSLETRSQLTKRLVVCRVDGGERGKARCQSLELVRQRVFGLACDYADRTEDARRANDAPQKRRVDRESPAAPPLASPPTPSRYAQASVRTPRSSGRSGGNNRSHRGERRRRHIAAATRAARPRSRRGVGRPPWGARNRREEPGP